MNSKGQIMIADPVYPALIFLVWLTIMGQAKNAGLVDDLFIIISTALVMIGTFAIPIFIVDWQEKKGKKNEKHGKN